MCRTQDTAVVSEPLPKLANELGGQSRVREFFLVEGLPHEAIDEEEGDENRDD